MFVGRVKDLSSENITGPASYMRKPLSFCQIRFATPERLFSSLSFTDIADEASKYPAPIRGQFSERDFHRKLLSIFAQASKLVALPVDMPLGGSQVAAEPILVEFPQ